MNRRTKIVCTLGPATNTEEMLRELIETGMDVARINFSHGDHEEHARSIQLVRTVAKEMSHPIAILGDLPGPKIRIGEMAAPVHLNRGDSFTLTRREVPGDEHEVHLPAPEVFHATRPGASLFLDDGLIGLDVLEVTSTDIKTRVMNGGHLSSHKGLVLPGVSLGIPSLTDGDRDALRFIAKHDVDWVAISFVRSAEDVRSVRHVLEWEGKSLPIIAKIEKLEAVEALDSVLEAADGLMVARGDLGVERPIYEVPLLQKEIIRKCNNVGKPVITATQMLDSMIRNPRPTRAEVTDVANAVLDGTDCVMLSGETAVGQHPIEAVRIMDQVLLKAESAFDRTNYNANRTWASVDKVTDAISQATYDLARELNAAAIITATSSGHTSRMVSRHRPAAPIIGITSDPKTFHRLSLTWGVQPLLIDQPNNTDETLQASIQAIQDRSLVKPGDIVVVTAGVPTGIAGNTNLIKVHQMGSPLIYQSP